MLHASGHRILNVMDEELIRRILIICITIQLVMVIVLMVLMLIGERVPDIIFKVIGVAFFINMLMIIIKRKLKN